MRRIVLALAAFALAACTQAQEAPRTPADIGIAMPADFSDWLRGHYTERVLLFHTYAPLNGQGVAFVGDSITEGGDWAALIPDVESRNFGIGGDTTIGLERRLAQIVAARPAKIFLLIGTNDLGNHGVSAEEIVANYALVLDRLAAALPDTQVYVQALLPREPHNAERVIAVNEGLAALAAARGLPFVDLHAPFAVEGGRLDPALTGDDLHLNAEGYARWAALIAPLARAP